MLNLIKSPAVLRTATLQLRNISQSFPPAASAVQSTPFRLGNENLPTSFVVPATQIDADLAHAAATTGIAAVPSIAGHAAPFASIARLFDTLYAAPHLAARLNSTYTKRGVFKTAGLSKPNADQKTTIDLSSARLENMQRLAPELVQELGADFQAILEFFRGLEQKLVPSVMRATSQVAGVNLEGLHASRNNNFRLVDYFAKAKPSDAPRCGAHRDYGTFSVILYVPQSSLLDVKAKVTLSSSQNGASSGLEYMAPSMPNKWNAIPATDVAIVWGWCSAILSGDRVRAAMHRVQSTEEGTRRQSAVLFVAPDLDAVLKPLNGATPEPLGLGYLLRCGDTPRSPYLGRYVSCVFIVPQKNPKVFL